ncbi:hypothetical protein EDB83DRAFT_1767357 [Lactarius deliciosus]|nr:hypothetical protein EDB83DRAFT_1767357 [Lactarius deliciosus]
MRSLYQIPVFALDAPYNGRRLALTIHINSLPLAVRYCRPETTGLPRAPPRVPKCRWPLTQLVVSESVDIVMTSHNNLPFLSQSTTQSLLARTTSFPYCGSPIPTSRSSRRRGDHPERFLRARCRRLFQSESVVRIFCLSASPVNSPCSRGRDTAYHCKLAYVRSLDPASQTHTASRSTQSPRPYLTRPYSTLTRPSNSTRSSLRKRTQTPRV